MREDRTVRKPVRVQDKFTDDILARWWRGDYGPQDLVRLVNRINETSESQVTVVGPLPRWDPALNRVWSPAEIAEMKQLPLYTRKGLMDEPFRLDGELRPSLAGLAVTYMSPLDILCRSDGCRVTVDDRPSTLTAWDDGHLTSAGSRLLSASAGQTISSGVR